MKRRNYSGVLYTMMRTGFVFPGLIILVSIGLVNVPFGIGVPFVVLLCALLFFSEGIEINFERNEYRNYKIYFVRFGKWKKLPKIIKVKMSSGTVKRRMYGRSTSSIEGSEKYYFVNLIFNYKGKERNLQVLRTKNRNKAEEDASFLNNTLILN